MSKRMKASLFITCLVDQLYPDVGLSMVRVLQKAGVDVQFPEGQTCCGQPAFNSGFNSKALDLAHKFLNTFEDSDYVVLPSGSCGSMIKVFYEDLFKEDPALQKRMQAVAGRTYEFSQFLVNVLGVNDVGASFHGKATYHASCHLLRELGATNESINLMKSVQGLEFIAVENATVCCGFGGTFSVKYPDISEAMIGKKLDTIQASGADIVVANDSGCLMQLKGAMGRRKLRTRAVHLAELLDNKVTING